MELGQPKPVVKFESGPASPARDELPSHGSQHERFEDAVRADRFSLDFFDAKINRQSVVCRVVFKAGQAHFEQFVNKRADLRSLSGWAARTE